MKLKELLRTVNENVLIVLGKMNDNLIGTQWVVDYTPEQAIFAHGNEIVKSVAFSQHMDIISVII